MTLQKHYFSLLFILSIFLNGALLHAKTTLNSAIAVSDTATIDTIKAMLQSEGLEKLYSKSYYSLLDRMQEDGFLPESLTGSYPGMYPRTTGAYVLLLIETGRLQEAELTIKCVLDALSQNGMERVCHVINKDNSKYTTDTDDTFQIDGQAHVILAWARLALKRGHTQFEDDTWAQVSALMARTCDRTFFDCGGAEPKLVMNTAFEHSRDFRYWDCWDLLTQSFVGAAMSDMIKIAQRRSETDFAIDWEQKIGLLSEGIKNKLVVSRDGRSTYIEMLVPQNGKGGVPYMGVSWVNYSPVAAGWEGVSHQVMRNTVSYIERNFLQTTNGIHWMPTDMYTDGSFTNSVIGKGIGWELEFARSENNYTRMKQILQLIRSANINSRIYMEFAWLDGAGYTFQGRLSTSDIPKMTNLPWKSRDAGNGEQTAWWCWAMARLRNSVGLSAEPARIEIPANLISISSSNGWGKRLTNIFLSSGSATEAENPYKLLIGEDGVNSYSDKWFSNNVANPWVIFSLSDFYKIEKIEFRDGRWFEPLEGVSNCSEYSVYVSTTGTDDADWIEICHETGVDNQNTKTKVLDIPVEARYIKFMPIGGGIDPKKVWIYGFDIYGTFSRSIDRGDLISVGKTIVSDNSHASDRETPANLLDGTPNHWATNKNNATNKSWVIVDLEDEYTITKFSITDSPDWITGYKVYVSGNKLSVDDVAWTQVASATFVQTQEKKEITLVNSIKGRYVKMEIPVTNQTNWTRIKEFEIYGTK